jgi:hypothetical protein
MGPAGLPPRRRSVRLTRYNCASMSIFAPSSQDSARAGVIESAEVPGPVFTDSIDYEAVKQLSASRQFTQLRALVRQRMARQAPAT